jgi:D-galactose 1-dehydrogenase
MTIRVCLVGHGNNGRLHRVTMGRLDEQFRLVAIADPNPGDVPSGLPVFDSLAGALSSGVAFDAASICTPPSSHAGLAREAMAAGLDVLLEKPPALSTHECVELERLAAARARVLFFGYHSIYHTVIGAARDYFDGVPRSDIERIEIHFADNVEYYHPNLGDWIFDPAVGGGGALMDSGINALSVLRFVLRLTKAATLAPAGIRLTREPGMSVETRAEVDFQVRGIPGHIVADWRNTGREIRSLTIYVRGRVHEIDLVAEEFRIGGAVVARGTDRELAAASSFAQGDTEYDQLFEHFARCCRDRTSLAGCWEVDFIKRVYRTARLPV